MATAVVSLILKNALSGNIGVSGNLLYAYMHFNNPLKNGMHY